MPSIFSIQRARDVLTVTGARVVMELRGVSCLPLTMLAPQRKGLAVTRTFGSAVTEWDELAQAISTYATRAGEKLRQHGLLACSMTIFIQTNRFVPGEFYSNAASFGIEPLQDSFGLIELALKGARRIWKPGFRYWKAGVMLNDLIDARTAAPYVPCARSRTVPKTDDCTRRYQRPFRSRHAATGGHQHQTEMDGESGKSLPALYDTARRCNKGSHN